MIALLLNASSFADFINLTKYLGTVQDANVAALNELDALEEELNGKLAELSEAKDRQTKNSSVPRPRSVRRNPPPRSCRPRPMPRMRRRPRLHARLPRRQNASKRSKMPTKTPINSLRVAATREAPRTDRRLAVTRTPTKAMATREARAETRAAKAMAAVATAATIRAVRPIPPVPG